MAPSAPTSRAEQLRWATDVLERSGSPDPAGEAAALLAAVLGVAGGPPASRAEALLAATDVDRFLAAVARRSRESRSRP